MRSSAVEGPHAPRARQTPPTGSSGGTVGLASSPHSHSSPRPQLTAGALPIKSSLQGVSRGSNLSPSPQNRPPSQARTVSGQAQVQRSQQRTADQQQRSPPNNITPSSNSISSNSKSLPPGHKGGQPRPAQQSQSNKSSFPQQTVSSKSSTPGPKPQAGASLKQVPSAKSAQSANPPNFGEYDDQEWDVGVGHLIIDLDADIAQADRGKMSSVSPASSTNNGNLGIADDKHSLKMKIKRTKPPTKTSEAKHEIVKTESAPNSTNNATPNSPVVHSTPQHNGAAVKEENGSAPRGPTSTARVVYKKEKRRLDVNGVTSPPAQSVASSRALLQVSSTTTTTTTSSAPLLSQSQPTTNTGVVTPSTQAIQSSLPSSSSTSTLTSTSIKMEQQVVSSTGSNVLTSATKTTSNNVLQGSAVNQNNDISHSDASASPAPASKRPKLSDENVKRDVCVGTSVGTLTEPECLGPCEPGSSVTLEGIVWHETEGGVLVVNVTWRGKTYVGTLLDCTKHDWAPPRFCDSPTSDLESRTPKGRGKRGRANTSSAAVSSAASATNAPVPATSASSNSELTIAETRSGKLRQTSVKGRGRGGAVIPASPVKDVPGMKRKVRDGDLPTPAIDPKAAKKPRTLSRGTPTNNGAASPIPDLQPQQDNGSNTDIEVIRPLISPQLIECPEPNCNKKYRHINGLKYHQTHAHGNPQGSGENTVPMDNGDSKSMTESLEEEENRQPSPKPLVSSLVDASQDIVKPAVLRPSAVTSNESKESSVKVLNQAVNIYSGSTPPKESLEAKAKPEEGLDSVQVLSSSSVNNLHPNKPNSTDSSNQAHPNSVQQTGGRENVSRNGNTASHLPSDPSLVPMQQKTSRVDSSLQPQVSHKVIQKTHHVPSQIPPNMSHSLHQTPPQHKHPVNQNLAAPLTVAHQSNHLPAHLQQSSVQLLQKPSIPVNQNQKASSPLAQMIHPAQVRPQSPQVLQGSSKPISTPHPQPPLSLSHSSLPGQSHPSPIIQQSPMRTDAKQDLLNRLNSANRPPGGGSEPTVITSSALSAGISSVPQGTPLSSLPGSMGTSHKLKPGAESDPMAGAPKEIVNGLPPKPETDLASREDTRSPAYSDISDANDSAPVIDGDVDGKDFKDEKKGELGVGGAPPYAYSLYYGSYGQPPHPYLMPPLSHSQQGLPPKPVDREIKDKIVDKDKAVPLPGGSEYMKIPPHYVYSYPHLYPPGYPEMYLRDSVGKDFEKGKMNPEELGPEENGGKGPTDLSKSSHCLDREGKIDSIPSKDPESHGFLPSDRRPMDSYRYVSSYDPRVPLVGSPSEKPMEIKIPGQKPPTPVPLLSPRHNSTPPGPNTSLREDKLEKRPDAKPEGVKPTMETTGPPPPPNSSAYYPHFPYGSMSFDPYRPPMIPGISAGMPAYLGGPPPGLPGLRYPLGVSNCPEDLSSGGSGPPLPPGLYAGSHKMAELHERAQKSPSAPPGSVSSPMSMGMNPPHGLPPSVSSPTSGISQASMISASHLGERKTPPVGMRFPPHPSLPDGYPPYPFLPTHFPPHFAALGMNPTALPTVGVGGPGVPPSGMGGVAHPPK